MFSGDSSVCDCYCDWIAKSLWKHLLDHIYRQGMHVVYVLRNSIDTLHATCLYIQLGRKPMLVGGGLMMFLFTGTAAMPSTWRKRMMMSSAILLWVWSASLC